MAALFHDRGLLTKQELSLQGRELAEAVARAMMDFSRAIGAPVTLGELKGFSDSHVERILKAAKDPQLKMKLQNMPVPMNAEDVDLLMEPLIRAAIAGDMALIVNK